MPNKPLDDAKIEKLTKLFEVANEDTATPGQVADALNHVIDATRTAFGMLKGQIDSGATALADHVSRLTNRVANAEGSISAVRKELSASIKRISLAPGPKGEKGEQGPSGRDGKDGKPGKDGKDGQDGRNGKDGASGNSVRIGWGAHPLTIQALGVTIDKVTRFINFTGSGIGSVSRSKDGVVTVNISGGGSGGTQVSEEVPVNSGDDINFTVEHTPTAGTFRLYRGGARQASIGATPDYSLTGTALVLGTALNTAAGELLFCDYEYV